MKYSFLN
ncbi:unnamed protein product, partial [Onchocerca ochengi]|uniref:Uncharacterized protein n=1 Tax=Onchocerca ochengi TaxID=42157 RepID=A0A5K4T1V7_ONCOC